MSGVTLDWLKRELRENAAWSRIRARQLRDEAERQEILAELSERLLDEPPLTTRNARGGK